MRIVTIVVGHGIESVNSAENHVAVEYVSLNDNELVY